MTTPIARIVEPAEFYKPNQGEITFYLSGVMKYPELKNAVFSLHETYSVNEAVEKAAEIEKLEVELDELIDKKRLAASKVSIAENVHLEAMRNHANAESNLRNRTTERNQMKWGIQERVGLRKRSEKADDDIRIAKAQQWVDRAADVETEALTALRYAISDLDEARAALATAIRAELSAKAALDRLQGIKNDYSESGLSMG